MIQLKRSARMIALVVVALAVAAGLNLEWMIAQRAEARGALEDLERCRQLVGQIASLRDIPTVASTETMGVQELGDRIQRALRLAQLEASAIEGIYPQSARRVGDSPYLLKPTQIVFRGVTLPQLTTFLYHMNDDTGMNVSHLNLSTPRSDATDARWDADATLTYLIFSPPKNKRAKL